MQRTPQLEWHYAEDPDEWDSLTGLPTPVTRPALPRRVVRGGLLALFVMLAGPGGWLWHTAHIGLKTIEHEIDAAVNADVWGEHQEMAKVELLDLDGEVAVVEVEVPAAAGLPVLRQTRVYRQTQTGWARALPSTDTWGAPRRLETDFFVFHYYERDEEAVKAAAAHLDRLYPTLYAAYFGETSALRAAADFGDASAPEKQVVEVDPNQAPGKYHEWKDRREPVRVASPAAYQAPGDITPADLLAQSIVLELLDRLEFQLASESPLQMGDEFDMVNQRWTVVSGITLWQLWATDLPLARWREPVVQWVFRTTPLAPDQPYVEPDFAPELCAMHKLWMVSPIVLQLPFACDPRLENTQWVQNQLHRTMPLTKPYLASVEPLDLTRAVALATAMEYAAATYGKERIPLLLDSMVDHGTWEASVRAVFGISAEEFEEGWTAYLAEHYGVEIQLVD